MGWDRDRATWLLRARSIRFEGLEGAGERGLILRGTPKLQDVCGGRVFVRVGKGQCDVGELAVERGVLRREVAWWEGVRTLVEVERKSCASWATLRLPVAVVANHVADSEPITNKVEKQWLKWKKSTFLIHPPTPDGCHLSSGNPCAGCTALETMDALDQNDDLVEDRQTLVRQINSRHDPLSYYLPFELAARIFTIYYDDTGYAESVVHSRISPIPHTPTPLRLAAVCRRWRDIAFNITALWSSLRVSYNPLWYTQANLVAQWLGRAGTRPLCIRIAFVEKRSKRSMTPLFDAIRRYSDRWKVLNLFISTKLCKAFLGKLPVDAPLLETLQLDITNVKYVDTSPIATLATPRLKKLHMWRLWLATVDVEWAHLTSVRATRPSVDEIFEILRRAPGLLECAFSDICDDSLVYTLPSTFTHPSLRALKLFPKDYMEDDVMYTLFARLALPALQKLTYDFQRSLIPLDLDTFARFLGHAGGALTVLALENIEFHCIPPAVIIAVLERLPTLAELHLKCWEIERGWRMLPDALFHRLAASASLPEDGFLPHLQTLVYRGLKVNLPAWKLLAIPLTNLLSALEHIISTDPTDQKNTGANVKHRPLHTVSFTLVNKLPMDDVINVPGQIFRHFLRIRRKGVNVRITEEVRGRQENVVEEVDLLLHFIGRTFSEFDGFPAYWFDERVPVDQDGSDSAISL